MKASQVLPEDIRAVSTISRITKLALNFAQIKGLSLVNTAVDAAGTTAVGVVTGVPSGESDFAVNDTVFVVGSGLWRSEALVSKSSVSKLALSSEDAATLPSFLTAWGILKNFANLKAGDTVVQSSGTTAVGQAITQVGKALGLNVLSPTNDELKDPKFVANMKPQKDSIKLVVSDRSGRATLDLVRVVADKGAAVFYNGQIETLEQATGVDVPAASNIYKNVSVNGFDLGYWHKSDPSGFAQAVASVAAMGAEKKINLKPKVYPQSDFAKAIADVESSYSAVVLKV